MNIVILYIYAYCHFDRDNVIIAVEAIAITMMYVPSSDCTLASRRAGEGQEEEAGGRRGRRGLRQEQLNVAKENIYFWTGTLCHLACTDPLRLRSLLQYF